MISVPGGNLRNKYSFLNGYQIKKILVQRLINPIFALPKPGPGPGGG